MLLGNGERRGLVCRYLGRRSIMLDCNPVLFSCTYDIHGASAPAQVRYYWGSEQGSIDIGSQHYEVVKQGWLSGEWTLECGGQVIARALQPLFTRSFEVEHNGQELTLSPVLFSRQFDVSIGSQLIGTIGPTGVFTRRSLVQCDALSELMQIFCFWLVALTWRRD
jgi:hypothetical protein